MPTVLDATAYGSKWVEWWTESQPQPRGTGVWPLPKDIVSDISWRKFPAHGPNGLFLAVMAMSWWAHAVKSADNVPLFEGAVGDLHWVIQELIRTRSDNEPSSQSLSPPVQPKSTPRRPKPTPRNPPPSSPQPSPSAPQPSPLSCRPPSSRSARSLPGVHTYERAVGKRQVRPSRKARDGLQ